MKKMLILVLLAMLLAGCTRPNDDSIRPPRLVTGIEVSYNSGSIRLQRQYTDEKKMRSLLDYLRCLDVYGTAAADIPIPDVPICRITLSFSDGTCKVYEQRDHRFLRRDDGPWHYIEPEQAQELPLLLGLMESDE